MPNWNTTDYTLYGNKENIKRLYTDLKKTVDIDRQRKANLLHSWVTLIGSGTLKKAFCQMLKKNCQPEVKYPT